MATKKKVRRTQISITAQRKQQKKSAKKHSKPRRVYAIPEYQPVPEFQNSTLTYEEAVIKNIVENSGAKNVPDEALVTSSTISSLSGSMKELHYRSGVSVGRELYKINSARKSYMFPEESVADLVAFFEAAGHRKISYSSYPGTVEIRFNEKVGPELGTSLHSFEAGIISGYLSSAEQRHVPVSESMCKNNNGTYCRFTTDQSIAHESGDSSSLDKLADHITGKVQAKLKHAAKAGVSNEYYLLSSALLLDRNYIESIKSIASYMGKSIGERLHARHNGKVPLSEITSTIRMLNLGNPLILDTKPFHMQLAFDKLTMRKEFVDVSLAFVNGLLANRLHKEAIATEKGNDEDYIIDIRELKN